MKKEVKRLTKQHKSNIKNYEKARSKLKRKGPRKPDPRELKPARRHEHPQSVLTDISLSAGSQYKTRGYVPPKSEKIIDAVVHNTRGTDERWRAKREKSGKKKK